MFKRMLVGVVAAMLVVGTVSFLLVAEYQYELPATAIWEGHPVTGNVYSIDPEDGEGNTEGDQRQVSAEAPIHVSGGWATSGINPPVWSTDPEDGDGQEGNVQPCDFTDPAMWSEGHMVDPGLVYSIDPEDGNVDVGVAWNTDDARVCTLNNDRDTSVVYWDGEQYHIRVVNSISPDGQADEEVAVLDIPVADGVYYFDENRWQVLDPVWLVWYPPDPIDEERMPDLAALTEPGLYYWSQGDQLYQELPGSPDFERPLGLPPNNP